MVSFFYIYSGGLFGIYFVFFQSACSLFQQVAIHPQYKPMATFLKLQNFFIWYKQKTVSLTIVERQLVLRSLRKKFNLQVECVLCKITPDTWQLSLTFFCRTRKRKRSNSWGHLKLIRVASLKANCKSQAWMGFKIQSPNQETGEPAEMAELGESESRFQEAWVWRGCLRRADPLEGARRRKILHF